MRRALRVAIAAACATGAWAVAAPPATGQIQVECFSPAETSCSGTWHRANVRIDWSVVPPFVPVSGWCIDQTINWDTPGTARGCKAATPPPEDEQVTRTITVRVDRTAPLLADARPARGPDANGWYRNAVRVAFSGTDATSGILGCTTTTYDGPDATAASVRGECRDRAGNVAGGSFGLRYDATPPVVRAVAPDRPPDHAGWYTKPVGFSVGATDATSGLAGCDPLAYSGPDSAAATVTATCRDRAGNAGSRSFTLPFDATAPALAEAAAAPADRVVRLNWAATGAAAVQVTRSPGRRGEDSTVLHRGGGTRLVDRNVRNGRRYEYLLTAVDEAGNSATRTLAATPGPRLLEPERGARLDEPPLLRWTRVRGARYYNVQLFRSGRKVLSAWPSKARLQLERRWRYRGARRLRPGRYRWLVWPGEGRRARSEYGRRIGERTFTIAPNP